MLQDYPGARGNGTPVLESWSAEARHLTQANNGHSPSLKKLQETVAGYESGLTYNELRRGLGLLLPFVHSIGSDEKNPCLAMAKKHPFELAISLAELGVDYKGILAALLFPFVPEGEAEREFRQKIIGIFPEKNRRSSKPHGEEIAGLAKSLHQLAFSSRLGMDPSNISEDVLLLSGSGRDIRVMLALLEHQRLLTFYGEENADERSRREIAIASDGFFAPLAHLLDMPGLAEDLENVAFKILDPDLFKRITDETKELREKWQIDSKTDRLLQIAASFGIPFKFKAREKRPASIRNKMGKNKVVHDRFGLMLVPKTWEECVAIYDAIRQVYDIMDGSEDKRTISGLPRRAANLCIGEAVLDLQCYSEEDYYHYYKYGKHSAHGCYKVRQRNIDVRLFREFMDLFLRSIQAAKNGQKIDPDLAANNPYIYVMTPKGQVHRLPKGSVVLDFAYSVHRDLGRRCYAARINGKDVSYMFPLPDVTSVVEILAGEDPACRTVGDKERVRTKKARRGVRDSLGVDPKRPGRSNANLERRGRVGHDSPYRVVAHEPP